MVTIGALADCGSLSEAPRFRHRNMSGAPTLEKAFDRTPVARRVGRTRSPPTESGSVGRVGTRGTDDHRRRRLRPLAGQGQGSLSDAEDLLHEARKAYGLSHLVYESGERIGVVRTVICTIQTERRDEYVERRRTLIDPVRKWSLKSRMPVECAGARRVVKKTARGRSPGRWTCRRLSGRVSANPESEGNWMIDSCGHLHQFYRTAFRRQRQQAVPASRRVGVDLAGVIAAPDVDGHCRASCGLWGRRVPVIRSRRRVAPSMAHRAGCTACRMPLPIQAATLTPGRCRA